MLLGYRKETGEIEFLFSDTEYLKKKFPNNTAKIINFWKIKDHGLVEYFIKDFKDFQNYKHYRIIDGKLIKKTEEEIKLMIRSKSKKIINNDPKRTNMVLPKRTGFKQLQ